MPGNPLLARYETKAASKSTAITPYTQMKTAMNARSLGNHRGLCWKARICSCRDAARFYFENNLDGGANFRRSLVKVLIKRQRGNIVNSEKNCLRGKDRIVNLKIRLFL